MKIEIEQETDGRWVAEAPDLPGVMAYGTTQEEAVRKVETLALHFMTGGKSAPACWPESRRKPD